MKLSFGYNRGLPADAKAAWGARFIVNMDGYVDFVWDRTDTAGPDEERAKFLDTVNHRYPMATMRADISAGLKSGRIHTREEAEIVLYDDEEIRVVGNSNASAGYFYVTAYAKADAA